MMEEYENKGWIPIEDVFTAYYDCRKNKRNTLNALRFELDYENNLVELWKDINLRRYEIGKSICFIVTKPKLREVFAADFRDRVVHHIIMMRLEPLFEKTFISETYSCRKGKGTLHGIKSLEKQIREASNDYTRPCYAGKFDMKGFFMTIRKPLLLDMLLKFIDSNYEGDDRDTLKYLVKKVVSNKPQYNCIRKTKSYMWDRLDKNKSLFTCGDDYGLPIGNLTSQCFANFYLDSFDKFVSGRFKYYGRYVDDFFMLSDSPKTISAFIHEMKQFLCANLGVILHPDKVYIQDARNGVKFIGGVVKPNRLYTANRTVSNALMKIWILNEDISLENSEHFIHSMNSYWGYFKHYKAFNIKKRLVSQIDRRWFEYITIDGKLTKFGLKGKNVMHILRDGDG